MTDTDDPLRRATAGGDPACPDGISLAALGKMARESAHPPRPIDLVDGVLARLDDAEDEVSAEAIDAFYDHGGVRDSSLERLGDLVRSACAAPRGIDLTERVMLAMLKPSLPLEIEPALDLRSRWRIWTTVAAAHIAALLAFTLYHFDLGPSDAPRDEQDAVGFGDVQPPGTGGGAVTPSSPLPARLPDDWSNIGAMHGDLFILRRAGERRDFARERFGMTASGERVSQGLRWLCAQQQDGGNIGALSGDRERDLTAQSLAALALLGEGADEPRRVAAIRHVLGWLCQQRDARNSFGSYQQATAGMAALALVEGAELLDDVDFHLAAEATVDALADGGPLNPGASGIGGFSLLAVETAQLCEFNLNARIVEEARLNIGHAKPADVDPLSRIGLSAFCASIYGWSDNHTTEQLARLLSTAPSLDADGRAEPLAWLLPSLALREFGGAPWTNWSSKLEALLLPCFAPDGDLAFVPAAKVASAGDGATGDVFATALTVLNLQVPYRYMPLATAQ